MADHKNNVNTNAFFGLVHALIEKRWRSEYEVVTIQLFHMNFARDRKAAEWPGHCMTDSF